MGGSRLLLVIDDVWREAQLRPFLCGGPNYVRLVTTRLSDVLKDGNRDIAHFRLAPRAAWPFGIPRC